MEIGRAVVRGEFPVNTALPVEADLMQRFGISRNILREAVKLLAGKGLLMARRRAGVFVQPMSSWNFLDSDVLDWALSDPTRRARVLQELTQLRAIFEPELAALAARVGREEDQLRLQLAYHAMVSARFNADDAIAADIAFHRCLLEASHNVLLMSFMPALTTLLRANFTTSIQAADGFIRNLNAHRRIADAISARDPKAARAAMHDLLARNEADLASVSGDAD